MQFPNTSKAAITGLLAASTVTAAAAAAGGNGTFYTTEVVTAYTTYCPSATTFAQGNKTYTVHSATTVTVTNCPCTITKPITSQPPSQQTPAPPRTMNTVSHFKGAGAAMVPEGMLAGAAAALMGLMAIAL